MRIALITTCLLAFAALATAQEKKSARRLEAVTWNPADHKLSWTVTNGKEGVKTTFEIDMDEATMSLNGEDRRFSRDEAVRVHALMNVVARYAAESTVWWEAGEGVPVDKNEKPNTDRKRRESDPLNLEPRTPRRDTSPPRGLVRISQPRAAE